MAMTNEELWTDTAQLAERLRQIRIEQGRNPDPEPRPKVVDIPLSKALVDRLQPFKVIAVKYAGVLASGQVTRIDVSKLAKYEEAAKVLHYSKGFWCGLHALGAGAFLQIIKRVNEAIDSGTTDELDINGLMRKVHFSIGLMTKDSALSHEINDYEKEHGRGSAVMAEEAVDTAIAEVMPEINKYEEDDMYE
ncbi:MAG TPA: hypothetical protein DEF35_04445 [Paenibacillus sp.]|uniref:hypothetical protein n=1 Tax=Paenibacillus TaxID=44249 RepID=UPI000BA08723|nr:MULTISPECIES: hypothetical protein [Paenibacillus]OZQ60771.1 hypothetical protein CA599_29450 [Paenibacillus taichungensis]HBU80877.1 hypothetical protein [Paenibacillus sp.]